MKKSDIEAAFPGHGQAVFDLIRGKTDPETYKSVETWVRECFNEPSDHDKLMLAINEEIEGYGVNAISEDGYKSGMWPVMEYVNQGESYATTVVYDRIDDEFLITSWGDWYESYESEKLEKDQS